MQIFASSWSLNCVIDPERGFIVLCIFTKLPIIPSTLQQQRRSNQQLDPIRWIVAGSTACSSPVRRVIRRRQIIRSRRGSSPMTTMLHTCSSACALPSISQSTVGGRRRSWSCFSIKRAPREIMAKLLLIKTHMKSLIK